MTAHPAVAGVEIYAKPSGRKTKLSGEALAFVAGLNGGSTGAASNC